MSRVYRAKSEMHVILLVVMALGAMPVLYLTSEGIGHHDEWSYATQDNWQCDATRLRQSPIDIETDKVTVKTNWRLDFNNYNQRVEFNIRNTHHSVSLSPIATESIPSVEVNWVPEGNEFELREIHFHWGDGINKGSEHRVNHEKAAAEMHMVHYRKGLDPSKIGSTEHSVVVVGVFIESDNMDHNKLEGLVSSASKVNGTDKECHSDKPEFLINLLPDNLESFFTYNGSLTTPPCYEVVTWVIMSQPVYLSNAKLEELSHTARVSASMGEERIGPNFRDIQPLLDRPVYSSYNISTAVIDNSMKKLSGNRFSAAFERYRNAFQRFEGRLAQVMTSIRQSQWLKNQRIADFERRFGLVKGKSEASATGVENSLEF